MSENSIEQPGDGVRYFNARGKQLILGDRTLIMGIVNVTPDSFSDGGKAFGREKAVECAMQLIEDGADIIDIGGESTRPGSETVPLHEELDRIIPVIRNLDGKTGECLISIDTYKAEVAREALEAGAHIVNDISAGNFDSNLMSVTAEYCAGAVLMHIKGTPRTMQKDPRYNDLVGEIKEYLHIAVGRFKQAGVNKESILVDPGIGFGKSPDHNLKLIRRCGEFQGLATGVLMGPSRKSFIGLLTGKPVTERLEGTIAAVTACILNSADVIRVHDVKQSKPAIQVADAIRSSC